MKNALVGTAVFAFIAAFRDATHLDPVKDELAKEIKDELVKEIKDELVKEMEE
ncbi:MAG: hypothetical protein GY854_04640, partial [Deltaproteobacteria bacterium]|nr:hypothetical protein [Deltaproteobacteria bacterium]